MDPLLATVTTDFCQLCATIAAMFVIDLWGRRFLLILGGGIMFVSMTTAAILAKLINDMKDDPDKAETKTTLGYLLVVAVCFFMIGFGPWGIIPWVYPSEIFPMDVKEKALSLSVCTQWGFNFLIAFLCPIQVKSLLAWGTLAFYAVCNVLVFAYVCFCVPEIKGIRVEDMDDIFGR